MNAPEARVLRSGDVEIDVAQEQVLRDGVPQHLRQKTLRVLLHLIEHRDRVVSKAELLATVWDGVAVTDDTLVQSIVEIRKALGDEAREARFIRTLPRAGYRFVAALDDETVAVASPVAITPDVAPSSPWFRSMQFRAAAVVVLLAVAGAAMVVMLRRDRVAIADGAPASVPSENAARRPRLRDAMTDNLEAYRLYAAGVARAQALQNPEAIALFEKSLALDPDFAMAHARIGYAYGVTWTHPDRARPHLERALQLGDRLDPRERLSIEAWRAISEGQYEPAIELLRGVMARYPTDVEAYLLAGKLLAAEERLTEAAETLQRGLLVDPRSPDLHNSLGNIQLLRGNKEEALRAHRRYVELAPREANAHDSLALTWQWMGEYDRAVEEYDRALALDPRFVIARLHLANTYVQMGRHREATAEIERYIADAPSDQERARGHYALWQIHRSRGDIAAATLSAKRAAIVPPIGRQASYLLALDRRDFATAQAVRRELDAASRPQPGRGGRLTLRISHYLRGYEALQQGREAAAIELFQRALRFQPPVWDVDPMEDCLANAYFQLGRYADAAPEYERVLRINPNQALGRYHLARTYEFLGRTADAQREYRRFLATWRHADPDVPQLLDARNRIEHPSSGFDSR